MTIFSISFLIGLVMFFAGAIFDIDEMTAIGFILMAFVIVLGFILLLIPYNIVQAILVIYLAIYLFARMKKTS